MYPSIFLSNTQTLGGIWVCWTNRAHVRRDTGSPLSRRTYVLSELFWIEFDRVIGYCPAFIWGKVRIMLTGCCSELIWPSCICCLQSDAQLKIWLIVWCVCSSLCSSLCTISLLIPSSTMRTSKCESVTTHARTLPHWLMFYMKPLKYNKPLESLTIDKGAHIRLVDVQIVPPHISKTDICFLYSKYIHYYIQK